MQPGFLCGRLVPEAVAVDLRPMTVSLLAEVVQAVFPK
jgi:hypothetical protein